MQFVYVWVGGGVKGGWGGAHRGARVACSEQPGWTVRRRRDLAEEDHAEFQMDKDQSSSSSVLFLIAHSSTHLFTLLHHLRFLILCFPPSLVSRLSVFSYFSFFVLSAQVSLISNLPPLPCVMEFPVYLTSCAAV